ncbi:helix-turn-helix transcriptional regulator [Lysinibacillus sp. CTST325]
MNNKNQKEESMKIEGIEGIEGIAEIEGTTFKEIQEMQQEINLEKYIILELVSEISFVREERNITQKNLSQISGVPQKTISRLENGKDLPKFSTLFKLLKALDLKMEINILPR